jgi:hypothetical protein
MDTKRKKLTLSEKLNVIHELKEKSLTSQVEMVDYFGLAPSSLSRILLNKNKIIEGEINCETNSNENEYKSGGQ